MNEILQAFMLVFFAELGDKSQLLAMTLATKYKRKTVLIGVFIGVSVNHVLAILLGSYLQETLSPPMISIFVGVIFIVFGILGTLEHPQEEKLKVYHLPPMFAVALLFFLGEIGDKTQFATLALSLQSNTPWILLIGTISAMMITSFIAILLGQLMGEKFPEFLIKVVSTYIFIFYGLFRLYSVIPSNTVYLLFSLIILILTVFLLIRYRKLENMYVSNLKIVAMNLKDYYRTIYQKVNNICLGEEVCGTCALNNCLIGYVKNIIELSNEGKVTSMHNLKAKAKREVNKQSVLDALNYTLENLKDDWPNKSLKQVHHVRNTLEYVLFNTVIKAETYDIYMKQYDALVKKI